MGDTSAASPFADPRKASARFKSRTERKSSSTRNLGLLRSGWGPRTFGSFLEGGLSRVRLSNRTLTATEVSSLYATDMTPRDGLVAEFLLNADTGTVANDTAQGNNGSIVNALGATQQ
jgi:hypothetical protein